MNNNEIFNAIIASPKIIYELLSEITLSISMWAEDNGLISDTATQELRDKLKNYYEDVRDDRKAFYIFSNRIIETKNNEDIFIDKLNAEYISKYKSFPDIKINNKISAVTNISKIMTEMINIKSHYKGTIDPGILILLSGSVLRLRELISTDSYEKHKKLWNNAAEIFSKELNLYELYIDDYDPDSEKADSYTNNQPAKPDSRPKGTLTLSEANKILAKIENISQRMGSYERNQQTQIETQRAETNSLFNYLDKVEKQLLSINAKLTSQNPKETKTTPLDQENDEIFESNDEPYISYETEDKDTKISTHQARDQLLQLRNKIRLSFPEIENWENILQRPIVNEMLIKIPDTKQDLLKRQLVSMKYSEHKDIMDMQLDEYWGEIMQILTSIDKDI